MIFFVDYHTKLKRVDSEESMADDEETLEEIPEDTVPKHDASNSSFRPRHNQSNPGNEASSSGTRSFIERLRMLGNPNTVRNITTNLGHVDGRSYKNASFESYDFSYASGEHSMSTSEKDIEAPVGNECVENPLRRSQSNIALNKRMLQSMNAFMLSESTSIQGANSLRARAAGAVHTPPPKKPKPFKKKSTPFTNTNKYIGVVPTAPIRDQPVGVGPGSDGINLRFRYKLTNLRRKVG